MYDEFARAYESRDVGSVTQFLADDWEADDGTYIDEIEESLQNSFDVFDRVDILIQGLSVSALPDGRYQASCRT